MRKSRFSGEQIIAVHREGGAGAKVEDLCRRHRVCLEGEVRRTTVSGAQHGKRLEEENARLRPIDTDQPLNVMVLKEMLGKGS